MHYDHMLPALFLERPNRFIAYADINGTKVKCHVKNTGRCRELLLPGTQIFLQHHPDAAALGRKTKYSLITVSKQTSHGPKLINMDSQAPNEAAWEWLSRRPDITDVRREVRYQSSRFDLAFSYQGRPAFMEIKGVTLEENGVARFPDAPTERGIKHLQELEHAAKEGYLACAMFVIAMKGIHQFEPNRKTHPQFGDALCHAAAHGVHILAYDCIVTPDSLSVHQPVPVVLQT